MKNFQVDTLITLKKYFNLIEKKYKNIDITSNFYPISSASSIGFNLLKKFDKKNPASFVSSILIVLKDILYSLNYFNYEIVNDNNKFDYNKIIFTWANNKNFFHNGSIYDPYFNVCSSELKKTLWFVIFLGKKRPKKIKENIVLLLPKTKKSFNIFVLMLYVIKKIPLIFKSKKFFLPSISNHTFLAEIITKSANKFFNKKVEKIFMPYEGQPFQTKLISIIKKNHKTIKVIGYIHSPPLALPSNLIFRKCCPHKLILNSYDQKYCFSKFLGWKKKNLIYFPSFRFRKNNSKYKNLIFFPLQVKNEKAVLDNLNYLHIKKIINLRNYKIKIHPTNLFSEKNKKIVFRFYKFFKNTEKYKKKHNSKFLIYIGNSGAAIESLERGNKVIHITEDNLLDMYSRSLWPNIKVIKIKENVYIYEINKKNKLIHLGNKKNSLKKFLSSNIY